MNLSAVLGDPFQPLAQNQLDPLLSHMFFQEHCHIAVKGRHNLIGQLNKCTVDAPLNQVLCKFDADEAAADHHRLAG